MKNPSLLKKILQPVVIVITVLLFSGTAAFSQSFISTWKTDNAGTSNATSITIPTTGSGYNYNVDWNNDGIFDETGITGSVTHDFGAAGTYTIRIFGDFPRIFFNNGGDKLKIIAIEQWGNIDWYNMAGAFWGAANLKINATDVPKIFLVTDLSNMLNGASAFNSDISSWVSPMISVTDMSGMLDNSGFSAANYDLLLYTFDAAVSNGNISSTVPFSAAGISYCAGSSVRQNLINYGWAITDAGQNCSAPFITRWQTTVPNQEIKIWYVTGTVAIDWDNDGIYDESAIAINNSPISHTYTTPGIHEVAIAGDLQQIKIPLDYSDHPDIIDIKQWGGSHWQSFRYAFAGAVNMQCSATDIPDLSGVTDIEGMFTGATSFNSDISNWDVSNVRFMGSMFAIATSFNSDISNWDVSNVTDMSNMFNGATSFNNDISIWDVSNVTSMLGMFVGATSFNSDISNWDVSYVTSMLGMFASATSFNSNISNWDVSNVTDMSYMFNDATSFNNDISDWDVGNVTNMNQMLTGSGLSVSNYDKLLQGWSVLTLQPNVSLGADNLQFCTAAAARQSIIDNFGWTINDAGQNCPAPFITKWQTTVPNQTIEIWHLTGNVAIDWENDGVYDEVVNLNDSYISHVYATPGIYEVAIAGDLQNIQVAMSYGFSNYDIVDIKQWGANHWQSFYFAFSGTPNLQYSATDIPDLSGVTDMSDMFSNSSFNGDISNWDVSNVTNMGSMFSGATLFNSDLSSWDVSNVTNMSGMFYSATSFNSDLSSWEVGNVTDMSYMFLNSTSFNSDISNWDVGNVTNMFAMLLGSGLSVSNYDNLLQGWAALPLQSNVTLGADNLQFCTAAAARQSIIDNFGWTISDNGTNCTTLPVSWLSFTATLQANGNALLQWQTASETNNTGFTIEKSTDSRQWSAIGFVPGSNIQQVSSYSFIDNSVLSSTNYYRIKQTDADGKVSYSKIVRLSTSLSGSIRLYPNPGNGELNIDGIQQGKYQLYNAAGKLVQQGSFASSQLHLSSLQPGMYFITLSDNNNKLKGSSKLIIR